MRKITPQQVKNEIERVSSALINPNDCNNYWLSRYHVDMANGLSEDESVNFLALFYYNKNLRILAYNKYKKFITNDDDSMFIDSLSRETLIESIRNYDKTKNVLFSTFASDMIIKKAYTYLVLPKLRQTKYRFSETLYDDVFIMPSDKNFIFAEHEEESYSPYETIDAEDNFRYMLKMFIYLTPLQQSTIVASLGLLNNVPITHAEIGRRLNTSRETVNKNYHIGLRKLRLLMADKSKLSPAERKTLSWVQNKTYPLIKEVGDFLNSSSTPDK